MNIRLLRSISFATAIILLSACVATIPQKPQYVQRAQSAIVANNFDGAYRILEDAFLESDPEIKAAAIQLYKNEPRLKTAAIESFSKQTLQVAYQTYGAATYTPLTKRRLTLFAQVASGDELKNAYENFEHILNNAQNLLNEEERKRAAEAARLRDEKAQKEAAAIVELQDAKSKAAFRCPDKSACDKAFALTQVFITSKSDMKIQIANETVIQTYNPTDLFGIGISAVRMPRAGSSADILISVNCKGTDHSSLLCYSKSTLIYKEFPAFMRANFIP